MSDYTSDSPNVKFSLPTRSPYWHEAFVTSSGDVLGTWIDEEARTVELCIVNSDPDDVPEPVKFDIRDLGKVSEMIESAWTYLHERGMV